jgi:hypothetical protein
MTPQLARQHPWSGWTESDRSGQSDKSDWFAAWLAE